MRSALVAVGFVVGLALLAPPAHAQTGGVRGKVVDEEGQPLVGSVVVVESQRISRKSELKTDKKGEYRMLGLQPGPYRVTAAKEGYQARYVEVDVPLGDPTEVRDIELVSLEAIARATGPSEDELRAEFTRAVELARSGRLDEAEAAFLDLLAVQSDISELHQNLAYVYVQKKDWARAEESYRTALELKPGDPRVILALAGVHEDAGEPDKALALLTQAVGESPTDGSLQFERGMLLLKAQKVPEASEALEAALAADASLTEAHYHLGTVLVNQGKVPEAVEHFEAYLASSPENSRYAETAKGMIEALEK